MFLKEIKIQGYKGFANDFSIRFADGINVLVGENGVGKTGIINSIRMLLQEDEFGRSPTIDTDFYQSLDKQTNASAITITGTFESTKDEEEIAFLTCQNSAGDIQLNLRIENKESNVGRYKRIAWGGESRSSAFEWELFDSIRCIYLPPLRDAEAKLREGKSSRLARLLKNLCQKELVQHKKAGTLHPLEQTVKCFNATLSSENPAIKKANDLIKDRLKEALGTVLGQETNIQYAEQDFNRIVESLRLVFFPKINAKPTSDELFRSLEENSLGYNNILYIATVMAELEYDDKSYLKILLIEEPEAHLHPQLQSRLLKYLESIKDVQIIVTTHSPVLASAVSVESLIHLSAINGSVAAVPIKDCGLGTDTSLPFLKRWLDATKSTLLFAKGLILVEGIAEAMVIPEMAKAVLEEYNAENEEKLPGTLEDGGVSVVNLNGIYFKHFFQLFCNLVDDTYQNIPVRCSGITDQDPPKEVITLDNSKEIKRVFIPILSDITSGNSACSVFQFPPQVLDTEIGSHETLKRELKGKNHALELVDKVNSSVNVKLYANSLKTFEYDLAMESSNLKHLLPVAIIVNKDNQTAKRELETSLQMNWDDTKQTEYELNKARAAYNMLNRIEKDKGEFAQILADRISTGSISLSIPLYIKKAIIWACGGDPDA